PLMDTVAMDVFMVCLQSQSNVLNG
ncbi:MAG: hypothetical protein QOI01_950, partial [Mycobacterium sp.]|nr:hypothetical protein [Mycobacterium sp.]